jgi:chemotaxis protein methyltransferase CheR
MEDVPAADDSIHVIWCRNVMIYFDAPTKIALARKLYRALVPGGYLFVGHSESLNGLTDQFKSVLPAVYRKPRRGKR